MDDDPVVNDAREQITAVDREIFEAVNRRIELVRELRKYKETKGYDFVDPGREQRMVDEQLAENDGPLSADGLRALYAQLLALTKREVS